VTLRLSPVPATCTSMISKEEPGPLKVSGVSDPSQSPVICSSVRAPFQMATSSTRPRKLRSVPQQLSRPMSHSVLFVWTKWAISLTADSSTGSPPVVPR
jgi:hypothetical protein